MPKRDTLNSAAAQAIDSPQNFSELFDLQVRRSAKNVALRFDGNSLTYEELARRIDAVSTRLASAGVGRGSRVAISLDRGFEYVVTMLAVLRAGGVFLPVDPSYPQERREFMLGDADPLIVITSARLAGALNYDREYFIIDEDSDAQETSGRRAGEFTPSGLDPAYVIYTSGSTGRPKGAVNTHQGLLNLAIEQIAAFSVLPSSRVLQFASSSFDASVSEVVMALGAGATLVLAAKEDVVPGPALVKILLDEKVTHVTLPPSVLAVLPEKAFPDLKAIVVAGEACPVELARKWSTSVRFFNAYGVSEAAVCSSIREFDPALSSLPIGKAMGGVDLAVLDDRGAPVQIGEVGELFIGGVGVSLGYLNRPELNVEKFVNLGNAKGGVERFYRSGDRVRLLLDGSLEYVGRQDNQVKIRGFRVELDEVALTIEQFEDVVQAVAIVTADAKSPGQLAGYLKLQPSLGLLVTREEDRVKIQKCVKELREFLSAKLPAHMVPSHLVVIDEFPLAPTGKVDLAKLRVRPIDRLHSNSGGRQPETKTEKKLAVLVCDVLGLDELPMEGSFLDMGGDSLQAAQLTWKIVEAFSVRISEADILEAPNFAEIAQRIDKQARKPLPKLVPIVRGELLAATPAQEIFGLLETLNVDTSALNCCAAFEVTGTLNKDHLSHAYRELFARHEGLRLKFPMVGEKLKITSYDRVDTEIEYLDFSDSATQADKLREFFWKAERICFSIQKDILVKCYLIDMGKGRSIFSLISHHAMFDAWSLHVFMQDLLALTAELDTGKSRLQPLRIQFLDYVAWLHKTLELEDIEAKNAYLGKVFERPLNFFDLRNPLPRPVKKTGVGNNTFLTIDRTNVARISAFCDDRQLTPFMVCTTLLKAALYLNSGIPDITVGGPVSIRYHRELENQIGLYGSAYIIRTHFSDREPIEELLQRSKENLLESYRSQVHSISGVLAQFEFELDLSRTAPYDISIASHMFDLPLVDPAVAKDLGITIKPYRYPLTTSFFDFEFTFHLFDGEIELETRYDAAIYTQQHIDSLTRDFERLLLTVLDNPDITLGKFKAM